MASPLLASSSDALSKPLAPSPVAAGGFLFEEVTIDEIQKAFADGSLTSRQLVEYYQGRIEARNPDLHAVIEVNPDALAQADKADQERTQSPGSSRSPLHGVPVLLKDNIATKDELNTTAGSLALLGTVVPRDAFVVQKLRSAGAIILGKASLTEWSGMRSLLIAPGWSARGGQGMNPHTGDQRVCGSSSGSAIAVAANMVAVSLGTETDGSIICPAAHNSVVGIKPTVGLTSRDGVVPISARQDTVGVIARTVSDAVHVLDVIAGGDANDPATAKADEWIPSGLYKASLKADGLKGKRLGILRGPYFPYGDGSAVAEAFESLFKKMRDGGAEVTDITIAGVEEFGNDQRDALLIEMKQSLNKYLEGLNSTKMRSIADIIRFNVEHEKEEKIREYGQQWLALANLADEVPLDGLLAKLENVTKAGLKKVMADETLDAVVAPAETCTSVLAIGGFPGITIPAGYDAEDAGFPFGICIGGLTATEPKLIEIAYALEQATKRQGFEFEEATIDAIQKAFSNGGLTSRQLVEYYEGRIEKLNPELHAVIQLNPTALSEADKADMERSQDGSKGPLHGVPVLLKDNIATSGSLRTTAGSMALWCSEVPGDAFVVKKLKDAGAIILGKASLSEWSGFRSPKTPPGWSAVGGQGMNPYSRDKNVSGSSSGSAISAAANLVTVALGTETDGSIISPAAYNSVVGIKPTVGLTSRDGVVPISARQDTVGVIARTVSDAVHVLDVIAGTDPNDPKTTHADGWIPKEKYSASLKEEGLSGKKVGILRGPFFPYENGSAIARTYEDLFQKMRDGGAELVDNIFLASPKEFGGFELQALQIELKQSLNKYLGNLTCSEVKTLGDVIHFNSVNQIKEATRQYGQDWLVAANNADETTLDELIGKLKQFTEEGLKKVMADDTLDAVVAPAETCTSVLAIGGFPGITIPAGYDAEHKGFPFGICIGGLTATEPKLIEIAYALEQATKVRRPPPL